MDERHKDCGRKSYQILICNIRRWTKTFRPFSLPISLFLIFLFVYFFGTHIAYEIQNSFVIHMIRKKRIHFSHLLHNMKNNMKMLYPTQLFYSYMLPHIKPTHYINTNNGHSINFTNIPFMLLYFVITLWQHSIVCV